MTIRVDWSTIKTRINGSPYTVDEPFLFFLPNGGRALLLSISDRLNWEASFRVDGYDYSDWDGLQALVDATQKGLMEGTPVYPLIEKLEEMRLEQVALRETIEGLELGGDNSGIIDAITGLLTGLDPRIVILLQLLDSIDDVLGGEYEPPALP